MQHSLLTTELKKCKEQNANLSTVQTGVGTPVLYVYALTSGHQKILTFLSTHGQVILFTVSF